MSSPGEVPELERFRCTAEARLLADGWSVDPAGESNGGTFFGSFVKVIGDEFAATTEFILESGPARRSLFGPSRLSATMGGEMGVRHLPTAARLRQLPVRMGGDTNISLDIADALEDRGRELPVITDSTSAQRAAEYLCDVVREIGEPFARGHANLDAMIQFVHTGQQVTRDELFQAIFVPAALLAAGRTAEAYDALSRYSQSLKHESDKEKYAEIVSALTP